jgi:hypothetical protein
MRGFSLLFVGFGIASAPAQAASSASLHLTAIIPVSCAVDVVDARIQGRELVLDLRRECNTAHNIVLAGQPDAALGDITLRYNEVAMAMRSAPERIAQPEAYYDGIDRVVIDVTAGTPEDLLRYAQSLNIAIDTA